MRKTIVTLVAAALLVGVGLTPAAADEGDAGDPPDEANFGICTARDNAEQGNDASDGAVEATPPFDNTSEEECENASHPGNESVPDDPADEGEDPPEEGEDPPDDQGTQQASIRAPVALP